jgi:hypothetical protein
MRKEISGENVGSAANQRRMKRALRQKSAAQKSVFEYALAH